MLAFLLTSAFLAVPLRIPYGPPAIEMMLHGQWQGGDCQGKLVLRPSGRFERSGYSPGNNNLAGRWHVRWDALPPTLVLKCDTSDDATFVGRAEELLIMSLNDKTLAYQYPGWKDREPIKYDRADIDKLVRASDLIVVGRLTITATRDGHVGTIEVSHVLLGQVTKKAINFVSPPITLPESEERIWFLRGERLEHPGVPPSERAAVVEEIARRKK
jgi:hypothetical protein